MPTSAFNVASWFIKNNLDSPRNTKDGNMKLQKLLYFSQLIHLAKYGNSLFSEKIIAFQNGSVIEEIRQPYQYQHYPFVLSATSNNYEFSAEESDTIEIANGIFGELSADELSELNHMHTSWIDAYNATKTYTGYHEKSNGIIGTDQMLKNEVPNIKEMVISYEESKKLTDYLEVNGRKFYYTPGEISFNNDIISVLESYDGVDSAYTIYLDESKDVVIF